MNSDSGNLRVSKDAPTLRELTTQTLREAILSQQFKPGEHLVERTLCERTGVSRTSLREALRHLESEGLVERQGSRGLFVASITSEEARQIYEVRAALEPEVGRLFAERATEAQIQALFHSLDEGEAAIAGGDIPGYVKALDTYYETLGEGSRNAVAERIIRMLHGRISYLRTITTAKSSSTRERETLAMLRAIAEAAQRRDGLKVVRKSRAFVERSAKFALKVLSEH